MASVAARRVRVILNPAAGRKAGLPTRRAVGPRELAALLARHRLDAEIVAAASAEEGRAAARDARDAGHPLVVAAGGDGTAGTVARELLGSPTALGLLPLGSVMNIARMLGIPRELEGAAAVLAAGATRAIDVGEARGRAFFECGSVGMNAAIFRHAQRVDRGHYAALLTALRVALRYRPGRMTIELDGRAIRTCALMVTVANGPYTGLGFTVAPDADLDDGLLDVGVFRHYSRWELLRHLRAIAFGRRHYSPHVATYRAARVRVAGARPLPCRADARDLGATPVEFAVRRAALRVVAPVLAVYSIRNVF